MRIVQFENPNTGRRLGVVDGDTVRDITSVAPEMTRLYVAFTEAQQQGRSISDLLGELAANPNTETFNYADLLAAEIGGDEPFLHPPLDHPDIHRVLITGTGLTHTGSVKSRDEMHAAKTEEQSQKPKTDSVKMFEMGLEGGKPSEGTRGVAPEWFYKGNGANLRGPNAELELPAFALDGGEEPELVGCYIIDANGTPRRLGFSLGNEWSDHATERINYLYLAPSKLRTCGVGPELITDLDFTAVTLRCTTSRGGETIYDSGELFSGEEYMCHSLANCEDHHFKYPQHRIPGDVHLHYFGTSKLSHSSREWKYQAGDEIRIESPVFHGALVNRVVAGDTRLATPVSVEQG